MFRMSRWLLLVLVVAGLDFLLVGNIERGRKNTSAGQDSARRLFMPSAVSKSEGNDVATLDEAAEAANGLVVTALDPVIGQRGLKAFGRVVRIQDLVELRNRFRAAKAEVERARTGLDAAGKPVERIHTPPNENRDLHDKALPPIERTGEADGANVVAAEEALRALDGEARQRWGETITTWIVEESPAFEALVARQERVVEVTLPWDVQTVPPPQKVLLQGADGHVAAGSLIALAPSADALTQGSLAFYRIPADRGRLVVGMRVLASLPTEDGPERVFVPRSAVVRWQGKAWVYVQRAPDRFVRREIPTDMPVRDGWSVLTGVAMGDRVVVKGGERLLSNELHSIFR
ncbi:MAG: hypothetical protein HY207_07375 [Nitrospirae bacterium]|nr:hypothetical protein [Nitrospirota bacterium]